MVSYDTCCSARLSFFELPAFRQLLSALLLSAFNPSIYNVRR